jgi:hypothetical protein
MSDQPPKDIYNEQPNQGVQGMFNALATNHHARASSARSSALNGSIAR